VASNARGSTQGLRSRRPGCSLAPDPRSAPTLVVAYAPARRPPSLLAHAPPCAPVRPSSGQGLHIQGSKGPASLRKAHGETGCETPDLLMRLHLRDEPRMKPR
jgi:hypothetical protein